MYIFDQYVKGFATRRYPLVVHAEADTAQDLIEFQLITLDHLDDAPVKEARREYVRRGVRPATSEELHAFCSEKRPWVREWHELKEKVFATNFDRNHEPYFKATILSLEGKSWPRYPYENGQTCHLECVDWALTHPPAVHDWGLDDKKIPNTHLHLVAPR